MKKKVAIIGIVGLPANYGGFESFTEFFVKQLKGRFDFTVYCSSRAYSKRIDEYEGVHLKYLPLNANGIQSIPYDMWAILDALRYADSLLILGVSGCTLLPLLRLFGCRRRIVVNIDGLEWRRDKWNAAARWFLKYSERCAVEHADAVVGDNKVIADYVAAEYGKPCELIEYGADHQHPQPVTPEACRKYPFLKGAYACGVCRIEPENNVALILEAFGEGASLPLVMVGNWNKSEYGRTLRKQYANHPGIHLLDPIYDIAQLNVLRSNCALYLHGHSCGGTNPSLIEAMYLGLPIAAFDVNFNRETTEGRAFYFSDLNSLRVLIARPVPVDSGRIMREIAERRYTWRRISDLYADLL